MKSIAFRCANHRVAALQCADTSCVEDVRSWVVQFARPLQIDVAPLSGLTSRNRIGCACSGIVSASEHELRERCVSGCHRRKKAGDSTADRVLPSAANGLDTDVDRVLRLREAESPSEIFIRYET